MRCGGQIKLGNLKEQSFDSAWPGNIVKKIRRTMDTDHEFSVCKNCMLCKQNTWSIQSFIGGKALFTKYRKSILQALWLPAPDRQYAHCHVENEI
jgi:hypothetical protein